MISVNTSAIRGFLVGNLPLLLILVLQVALVGSVHAFSSCDLSIRSLSTTIKSSSTRMAIHGDNGTTDVVGNNRRSFLNAMASSIAVAASTTTAWAPTAAIAAQEPEFRQGIKVDAFNGLIFNYRGGDFGGLSEQDVGDEPSVSYAEFNQRLAAGEVEFVEFLAPDGDKAYVTFKAKDSNGNSLEKNGPPIRIGEGYPIEKHDGFSSPLFCIRAVKNAGVPYKFVVPSLSKYSSTS
ncbi:hypothetical protein IV203_000199 [Nitzschia inconspicua]|uniref:Uncharacterized protein n=1 Tax=Nitzschia inconspicua TaxID=303405 RepID=A0A9K3PQF2_9STRA|nr:hypothetical protein IV203_000199 [Nitzschia inconspicua]